MMLIEATDKHFAWMLGEGEPPVALLLPPGGVDEVSILRMLREATNKLRHGDWHGSWLVVANNEVVGLCSYKSRPDTNGVVEIGYGISASRRKRGFATFAVSHLIKNASRDFAVRRLVAETAVLNVPSQLVLERNNFCKVGARSDAEEGELILWEYDIARYRVF